MSHRRVSASRGPIFLSPALPSEILTYVLSHTTHPTTLVICSSRASFLSALVHSVLAQGIFHPSVAEQAAHPLLSSTLAQLSVARHIRLVFAPTVSHLQAWASVFEPGDSRVLAPPPPPTQKCPARRPNPPPLLLVYGFLALHRDTSEWSAQGLGISAAALVEAAQRTGFRAVIVEPLLAGGAVQSMETLLLETVPILSSATRRRRHGATADGENNSEGIDGWMYRTVDIKRVLGRWFEFEEGEWESVRGDIGNVGPDVEMEGEDKTEESEGEHEDIT